MIFLSYSETDRALVEALVIDLGILGHSVYFEEKNLGGSQRWDEIFTSIEQADAFVYTLTRNTQASYSRLLEFEHALALGKLIVPVRFEDIDLWALPPGLPQIIDYQPQNGAVRAQIARALSLIPLSAPMASIARPELSFALSQVYQRVTAANKSDGEKAALLLNLREFLERRETYPAAASMLGDFVARIDSADPFADEANQMRALIKRKGASKSFFLGRFALPSLIVIAAAAIVFWLIRSSPVSEILRDPAPTEEVVANLPAESTLELLTPVSQSSATALTTTQNQLVSIESSVTASPTPPPSSTARPSTTPTHTLPTVTQRSPTQPPSTQPLPTQRPPTQRPPTQPPPTQPPPTQRPPTQSPPTQPTQPPPTQPPPTQPPPTQPPPTQPPPTQPPPTQPPPTQPPPTTAPILPLPTIVQPIVATLIPPVIATLVPPIISGVLSPPDGNSNQGSGGSGNSGSGSGNSGDGNSGSGNGGHHRGGG